MDRIKAKLASLPIERDNAVTRAEEAERKCKRLEQECTSLKRQLEKNDTVGGSSQVDEFEIEVQCLRLERDQWKKKYEDTKTKYDDTKRELNILILKMEPER